MPRLLGLGRCHWKACPIVGLWVQLVATFSRVAVGWPPHFDHLGAEVPGKSPRAPGPEARQVDHFQAREDVVAVHRLSLLDCPRGSSVRGTEPGRFPGRRPQLPPCPSLVYRPAGIRASPSPWVVSTPLVPPPRRRIRRPSAGWRPGRRIALLRWIRPPAGDDLVHQAEPPGSRAASPAGEDELQGPALPTRRASCSRPPRPQSARGRVLQAAEPPGSTATQWCRPWLSRSRRPSAKPFTAAMTGLPRFSMEVEEPAVRSGWIVEPRARKLAPAHRRQRPQ